MRIGITYDLKDDYIAEGFSSEDAAEFDVKETIDSIDEALIELGHRTCRIGHARHLIHLLAQGDRWDMVFNIAEGIRGFGREAQIPALLDIYEIPYTFSDPLTLSLTLHKGMTKRVIRDLKIPTADFHIIETLNDLKDMNLPYPLFAKPVAEGTSKGVTAKSKIISEQYLERVCRELLETFHQPVLIETYLPGREFTVGISGTGSQAVVLGVLEVLLRNNSPQSFYSYENKETWRQHVEYKLADDEEAREAAGVALAAWKGLLCRDGGRVDVKSDSSGIPNFIEVNPLAGLNPNHSDLPILARLNGIEYPTLIELFIESALHRVHPQVR